MISKFSIKNILLFSISTIIIATITQAPISAQRLSDSSATETEKTYNLNVEKDHQSTTSTPKRQSFSQKIYHFFKTIFNNIKHKIEIILERKKEKRPPKVDNNTSQLIEKNQSEESEDPIIIFSFKHNRTKTKHEIEEKKNKKDTQEPQGQNNKKTIKPRKNDNKTEEHNNNSTHKNNSNEDSNGHNNEDRNEHNNEDSNEHNNEGSNEHNNEGSNEHNNEGSNEHNNEDGNYENNDDENTHGNNDDNNSNEENNQENIVIKNVLVINYIPDIENQSIINYYNWNNPNYLASHLAQALKESSHNIVHYNIKDIIISRTFPQKEDSFQYNETTYKRCISDNSTCHMPDTVDYAQILTQFNICQQINNHEIDEVWIFGGPYFGFYESRLAGTNGYWYNSPPLNFPSCQRLVPIMGFNYERGLAEAIHSYGHRIESTMTKVYGGWEENHTRNLWEKFALVKKQSPDYDYSGCGTVHYPPNGASDYDYANQTPTKSNCYHLFNNNTETYKMIQCSEWNCTQEGYLKWWMNLIPHNEGTDNLGKKLNWWYYITDPNNAL